MLEWSKCLSPGGYIFPLNNGDYIYGTQTNPSTGWAFVIGRENSSGSIIWQKTYGNNASAIFKNMMACSDGGFIMTGITNYIDTDFTTHYGSWMNEDIAIIKLDSNGNKVWSKVIGGSGGEDVFSIVAAQYGGCYIIGTTSSNDYDCTGFHGGIEDLYLARLDCNGNLLWHRDLGGSGDEGYNGHCGGGTSDGKGGVLVVCGSSSGDGDVHHSIGGYDYWVVNVDSNNNVVWENSYGGPHGHESATSICKATDGSIWINGISGTPSGEVDTNYGLSGAWIVHIDSAGNYLGSKVLGGKGTNWGQMICQLAGGLVMAGGYYTRNGGLFNTLDSFGNSDVFLAILAPWNQTIVKQVSSTNSIAKIFPNPATNEVNIKMEQAGKYHLTISDVIGKIIYQANVNDKVQIPVKDWVKGMFYVQVSGEDGYRSVQKLMVE